MLSLNDSTSLSCIWHPPITSWSIADVLLHGELCEGLVHCWPISPSENGDRCDLDYCNTPQRLRNEFGGHYR